MSEQTLKLSIVSPEKIIFEGDSARVTLPGSGGSFTILPRHAPIVSSLKKGKLTYVANGQENEIDVHNGFVEKVRENVSVCITLNNNGNK